MLRCLCRRLMLKPLSRDMRTETRPDTSLHRMAVPQLITTKVNACTRARVQHTTTATGFFILGHKGLWSPAVHIYPTQPPRGLVRLTPLPRRLRRSSKGPILRHTQALRSPIFTARPVTRKSQMYLLGHCHSEPAPLDPGNQRQGNKLAQPRRKSARSNVHGTAKRSAPICKKG